MAKSNKTVTRYLMRVNNLMTPGGFAVVHDKVKVRGGKIITREDWAEVNKDMFEMYQKREGALEGYPEFEFKIDTNETKED